MTELPIAIVTPWFGRGLRGGAERHAWELAARLAARGNRVEVITTCCSAHQDDWATNHLPPGLSGEPEGFSIRRFPVAPRDRKAFDPVNGKLIGTPPGALKRGQSPITRHEEAIFADELMRSPDLLDHLRSGGGDYRAFLFLPYLYFTTLRGLPLVSEKAILVPCLHDEPYAYLDCVSDVFLKARKLLFISEGEFQLACRLFGPAVFAKGSLAGAGIDFSPAPVSDASVDIKALRPFVLCLGRQDPGKNTDFLVGVHAAYRRRHPESRLNLVLAGPGKTAVPPGSSGIVDLGAVSEAAKRELLDSCEALFNPSTNESYSRVIMEAWHSGRPVAVHRSCLATSAAVTPGEDGWIAAGEEEWLSVFDRVSGATPADLARMGARGRARADEAADWNRAVARYEAAILELPGLPRVAAAAPGSAIHQVLPNLAAGDAISNEAIWIRNFLRREGHPSEIFALDVDPALSNEARRWQPGCLPGDANVIYHHSIGSALTSPICSHPGRKALIYHNITPHRFLEPYNPLNSALCREARAQLPGLARFFQLSAGDSIYNAAELAESGFPDPQVLPLCVDPAAWAEPADRPTLERLQDGRTNILFVGRLSPNKRQEDLLVAFSHYLRLDPAGRLNLVGGAVSPGDLYEACLRRLAEELGIADSVNFAGKVTASELAAYYMTADLFWSMSEHEGFCVPLIEAMWFDVPVMAFAACAVPETMDDAGVLFDSKADPAFLAREALDLAGRTPRREAVLRRQRVRREKFLPGPVEAHLRGFIARLAHLEVQRPPPPAPPLENVLNIAVVKLDHIGDAVLATPVFFSLAMRFPGARITAIVSPAAAPLLAGNPHVDRVVSYEAPWYWRALDDEATLRAAMARNWSAMNSLMATPFDLVVNLRSDHQNVLFAGLLPHRYLLSYTNDTAYAFLITHPLTRTRGMHATRQHRELLRSIGADFWCDITAGHSPDDVARVRVLARPDARTVVLALGAGLPLKRWAPVKFRELARRLRGRGYAVSIVGTASDATLSDDWAGDYGCLDLCGRLNLNELAAFLSQAGCLVANDSAAMHIGAAVKARVVYIMRPTVREEFEPQGPGHIGCMADGCPNPCKGFDHEDRSGSPAFCQCIQSVTVDQVERAVLEVLAHAPQGPIVHQSTP